LKYVNAPIALNDNNEPILNDNNEYILL